MSENSTARNGELFQDLTATEKYLLNFVECLTRGTHYGRIMWTQETAQELESPVDENGIPVHPLFTLNDSNETVYESKFLPDHRMYFPNYKPVIAGDGYCASIDIYSSVIYLMKVKIDVDLEAITGEPVTHELDAIYEMYLVRGYNVTPLCYSGTCMDSPYANALEQLYQTISNDDDNIHIRPEIKELLDEFMNRMSEEHNAYLQRMEEQRKILEEIDELPFG
jgi:hypothetical protein